MVVWQQMLNLPHSIPLNFVSVQQIAAEGHSDKMASDTEVHMKQKYRTELLHVGKKKKKWNPLTFIGTY